MGNVAWEMGCLRLIIRNGSAPPSPHYMAFSPNDPDTLMNRYDDWLTRLRNIDPRDREMGYATGHTGLSILWSADIGKQLAAMASRLNEAGA